ncbi:MAG: universal stress protein [Bryobacterales bacterium]|nr:universal stress protein [Bryobacterales bacterium]
MKNILFPVDFSPQSDGAAQFVKAYAERFQARVTILHVLESRDYVFTGPEFDGIDVSDLRIRHRAHAQHQLDAYLLDAFPPGLHCRVLLEGDPASRIVEHAANHDSDLIMVPTHGLGPFRRFVLGSVTAKVLHDAACPVWTGVHLEGAPPAQAISFNHILCALDFGEHSGSLLEWVKEHAGSATVTLVHAVPATDALPEKYFNIEFFAELCRRAKEDMEQLQANAGTDYHSILRGGSPAKVIAEAAVELNADLVVIGRGAAKEGFARLWAQAFGVIHTAPCPVISV